MGLTKTILSLKGVSYRRGTRTILSGIDWEVQQGEHWAILGPNGCGKTTLLKILAGYEWPSEGEISVLKGAYGEIDIRDQREILAFVSASLETWTEPEMTAETLVLTGATASLALYEIPTQAIRRHANRCLKEMGLWQVRHNPLFLLSQGEHLRTFIARALMQKPELIILDEPFAGLDLGAREGLLHRLEKLAQKPTAPTQVIVTHHLEEIPSSVTHTLLMCNGKIVAAGPRTKTLTTANLSKTFGIQVQLTNVQGRLFARGVPK